MFVCNRVCTVILRVTCQHWAPQHTKHTHKRTQTHNNHRNFNATITQLLLGKNNFEGDLSALGPSRLMIVSVDSNPKLCGMVRAVAHALDK